MSEPITTAQQLKGGLSAHTPLRTRYLLETLATTYGQVPEGDLLQEAVRPMAIQRSVERWLPGCVREPAGRKMDGGTTCTANLLAAPSMVLLQREESDGC